MATRLRTAGALKEALEAFPDDTPLRVMTIPGVMDGVALERIGAFRSFAVVIPMKATHH